MNAVLSLIERIGIGSGANEADERLLDMTGERWLTRKNLTESVLVMAGTNKGKTTLARTLYRSMLRDRWGGLVLCVKNSQIGEFQEACRMEYREGDCFVLSPDNVHVFNPFAGETSASEAAALVAEISEVLAGGVRDGSDGDEFWRTQLGIILRNLFVLCGIVHGRFDVVKAAELFDARANSLAEVDDPQWRRTSPLAAAVEAARQQPNNPEAQLAVEYFTRAFPGHGDRLQGSLAATVASVFDHLRRPPLRDLFAGDSTFTMNDLLDNGKICVVGLPALDSADGKIANAILQFCFCRAATRQPRAHYSFLISDECQETVSRELMRKLAILREFKVASIMLTQNLPVLDDRIGETAREGFCGLLGLKLFGPQGHGGTRQWAAEQIGKRPKPHKTKTTGHSAGQLSSSTSEQDQLDYRVQPSRFAELVPGETICLRDGKVWMARWHKDKPGKGGTVGIV